MGFRHGGLGVVLRQVALVKMLATIPCCAELRIPRQLGWLWKIAMGICWSAVLLEVPKVQKHERLCVAHTEVCRFCARKKSAQPCPTGYLVDYSRRDNPMLHGTQDSQAARMAVEDSDGNMLERGTVRSSKGAKTRKIMCCPYRGMPFLCKEKKRRQPCPTGYLVDYSL